MRGHGRMPRPFTLGTVTASGMKSIILTTDSAQRIYTCMNIHDRGAREYKLRVHKHYITLHTFSFPYLILTSPPRNAF